MFRCCDKRTDQGSVSALKYYRIILKEQLFDFNIFKRVLELLCMFVCIGFLTSPTSSHFESRFIICPPPLLSLSSIFLGLPPLPPLAEFHRTACCIFGRVHVILIVLFPYHTKYKIVNIIL